MKTYYFAPVFSQDPSADDPTARSVLVRYAGVEVEATPPELRSRLKKGDGKVKSPPLTTGRNAAYAALLKTLAPTERIIKSTLRTLG